MTTFDESYERAIEASKKKRKRRPSSEYKKQMRQERKELAPYLDKLVLDYVHDEYRRYRERPQRGEPCVTAVEIREMTSIRRVDVPDNLADNYNLMTKSEKLTAINSSLQRLKRKGLLQSSLGFNMFGKEARCFEPVE